MSPQTWDKIREAVEVVLAGVAKKVDGEGYKVYKVSDGTIRIDIPPEKENQ